MFPRAPACILVLLVLPLFSAAAQPADTPSLTLETARNIMAAADAEARRNGWSVAVAVVDAGGHLITFQRMDGTQLASVDIAVRKARTSVLFKRPTKVFEDLVADGRSSILALEDVLPFEGGLPLIVDGQVIGAIGVSGVTPQQDGIIAQAGVEALVP